MSFFFFEAEAQNSRYLRMLILREAPETAGGRSQNKAHRWRTGLAVLKASLQLAPDWLPWLEVCDAQGGLLVSISSDWHLSLSKRFGNSSCLHYLLRFFGFRILSAGSTERKRVGETQNWTAHHIDP